MRRRLALAHLPTPLQRPARLAARMGIDLVVKRDDMTGGAEAGNKIRKLEFLLGEAVEQGADTVITCGGIQSNHARATALLAASLGLRTILYLRVPADQLEGGAPDPRKHAPPVGNVLLDRMAGAELRLITPEQYQDRQAVMAAAASELSAAGLRPYVIPEGGSSGLGSLGYVEAMAEVRRQLDLGLAGGRPFDVIVHACGSGGTAAGVALGATRYEVAAEVRAIAVCNDARTFEVATEQIMNEARALDPSLGDAARLIIDESAKGPAYAVSTPAQRRLIIEVARLSGLVLDPVYTGKAFSALWEQAAEELQGKRVLFLHTGGLPGLLAQGAELAPDLD